MDNQCKASDNKFPSLQYCQAACMVLYEGVQHIMYLYCSCSILGLCDQI